MDLLFLIGRILFGGIFVMNGINHFAKRAMMTQYSAAKHVPAPALAVLVSGALLLLGGLSVVLGLWPQIGLWFLVAFLVVVTPTMHNFWTVTDPNQKMGEMTNFLKNVALLGAALMMLRAAEAPWPLSLGQ